jgi:hypothetical protein
MATPSNDGPTLTHDVCEHIGVEPVWIRQGGELYLINRRAVCDVPHTVLQLYQAVWFPKTKQKIPLPRIIPILSEYKVSKKPVPLPWADLLRMSAEWQPFEIKAASQKDGSLKYQVTFQRLDTLSPHQWVRWVFATIAGDLPKLPKDLQRRVELSLRLESIGVDVSYVPESRSPAYYKAKREALQLTHKAEKFLKQKGQ